MEIWFVLANLLNFVQLPLSFSEALTTVLRFLCSALQFFFFNIMHSFSADSLPQLKWKST